jgi:hypothetical protein
MRRAIGRLYFAHKAGRLEHPSLGSARVPRAVAGVAGHVAQRIRRACTTPTN